MINKKSARKIFLFCFMLFSITAFGEKDKMLSPNIALGKKVLFFTEPKYSLTCDNNDSMQLTDGCYVEQDTIWHVKETVGWVNTSAGQFLIDLGKESNITGFAVDTVGGGVHGGVFFPGEINILVSSDGRNYRKACTVVPRTQFSEKGEVIRNKFIIKDLNLSGRYVFFELLMENSNVAFCDEVEVYGGESVKEVENKNASSESINIIDYCLNRNNGMSRKAFIAESAITKDSLRAWLFPLKKKPELLFIIPFYDKTPYILKDYIDVNVTVIHYYGKNATDELSPFFLSWIEMELEKNWDAVVVNSVGDPAKKLSSPLWNKIIQKSREGTGILCISESGDDKEIEKLFSCFEKTDASEKDVFADTIPTGIDFWEKYKPTVHLYSAKKGGRSVWLSRFPRKDVLMISALEKQKYLNLDLVNDYFYSFLSRAVCYSLGKNTVCEIKELKINKNDDCQLIFKNKADAEKIELRFWDKYRTRCYGKVELKQNPDVLEYKFKAPHVPNGELFVDILTCNLQGYAEGWGCFCVEKIGDVIIENVELPESGPKLIYHPGETLKAKISALNKTLAQTLILSLELKDNSGRLIAKDKKSVKLENGNNELECSIIIPESPTVLNSLKASLITEKKELLSETKFSFTVSPLPETEDDFKFLVWYCGGEKYFIEEAEKMGVDSMLITPQQLFLAKLLRINNMAPFYENINREVAGCQDGLTRIPCLNDPEYLKKAEGKLRKTITQGKKYHVIDYSYGDEPYLISSKYWKENAQNLCHSPFCLAEFRSWLKDSYKSLDTLNQSWGTSFKKWDEVIPLTLAEARKKKCPASWIDHRVFMDNVWINYHWKLSELTESLAPGSKFGFSGLEGPMGYDMAKIMKKMKHLMVYPSALLYQLPSFAGEEATIGQFLGYDHTDSNEMKAKSSLWTLLALGYNSATYYTFISSEPECSLLLPGGTWTRKAKWLGHELKIIKAGIGKLITNSLRVNTGLAIYYNPISWWRMRFSSPGLYMNNIENWPRFLTDNGYQYYYINSEQLLAGKLKDYKLLILPWSSCMTDKELEKIEEFVKAGGIAVTDVEFALYNEHGVELEKRKDSRIFGVSQKANPEFTEATLNVEKIFPPFNIGKGPFSVSTLQKGTLPLRAEPLGGNGKEQALFTQKLGKGYSVYMNFTMNDFGITTATGVAGETEKREENTGNSIKRLRRIINGIINSSQMDEPVRMIQTGANFLPVTRGLYRNGEAFYLLGVSDLSGKFAAKRIDESSKRTFEIISKDKYHVYDSRNGDYLGYRDRTQVDISCGIGFCYSFLPWKLDKISLEMEDSVRQGEKLNLKIILEGVTDNNSGHAVQVFVRKPDGKKSKVHSKVYYFKGNTFEVKLPLAFNEQPGVWEIMVTDAATKISSGKTFKIIN